MRISVHADARNKEHGTRSSSCLADGQPGASRGEPDVRFGLPRWLSTPAATPLERQSTEGKRVNGKRGVAGKVQICMDSVCGHTHTPTHAHAHAHARTDARALAIALVSRCCNAFRVIKRRVAGWTRWRAGEG